MIIIVSNFFNDYLTLIWKLKYLDSAKIVFVIIPVLLVDTSNKRKNLLAKRLSVHLPVSVYYGDLLPIAAGNLRKPYPIKLKFLLVPSFMTLILWFGEFTNLQCCHISRQRQFQTWFKI